MDRKGEESRGVLLLFVDETGNERFFIVAGLLVESEQALFNSYKAFKKEVSRFKITRRTKQRLFKEFKSTYIDRSYQRIKYRMLDAVVNTGGRVIYSCYSKGEERFVQELKEAAYLTLLTNIVGAISCPVEIVFDGFGKRDLDNKIVSVISRSFSNVRNIMPGRSELVPGLQFADNVCGALRLWLSGEDKFGYIERINSILTKV